MKMTVHVLETQMGTVDHVERGFTGQMDFIVIWHSVTSNGLLSKTDFVSKII
jgi:hypothetical protein